jgi:flagellar protein FlaG
VASDLDTDIEIISNPGSGAVYDDGADDVRLLVKNTGRRQISTSGSTVDVLIDGQYIERSSYSITVINGSEWDDGSVVRIVVDEPLSTGDHQATVIVRSERETLRFRV